MWTENLIGHIAERACDGVELSDLIAFYYNSQVDFLRDLPIPELIYHAIENMGVDPEDLVKTYDVPEDQLWTQ